MPPGAAGPEAAGKKQRRGDILKDSKNYKYHPVWPVMIVDDEPAWLRAMELSLRAEGITNIRTCGKGRDIFDIARKEDLCVVVLDLNINDVSGEEILKFLKAEKPEVPVVIITGDNQATTAVRCLRAGAFNYFIKSQEKQNLIAGVKHAVDIRELQIQRENLRRRFFRDGPEDRKCFAKIITGSGRMLSIFKYIEAIAPSPEPVLITGESGSGKELLAESVHTLSGRPGKFIPVNIGGLDTQMFSDTLFGHAKGAFTGAVSARAGLVEAASGGTLFLDEIGDLQPEAQIKLLRLIQEKTYFPLGSDVQKKADARIIAATNQDLRALQQGGRFRKDLFYRLCCHRIELPPLRERLDDIPLLLDHFIEETSASLGLPRPKAHPELTLFLQRYDFPGNVRELRSMIFDAVSRNRDGQLTMDLFTERISPAERPAEDPGPGPGQDAMRDGTPALDGKIIFGRTLPKWKDAMTALVDEAMRRAAGNQTSAAVMIGMNRQTLNKHLLSRGARGDDSL
jgi:DNA-binding NtrC family response regulator